MAQTAQKTTNDTTASSNILFINKVKINNDGTAAINFSSSSAQNAQEVAFQGKEEVTKDFFETFQATVKSLLNALPRLTADEKKITMNVIAFNYGKDEFLSSAGYSAKYAFRVHFDNDTTLSPQLEIAGTEMLPIKERLKAHIELLRYLKNGGRLMRYEKHLRKE